MLGANFLTNTRDESEILCNSFGRLLRSVEGLTDPESDALVVQVGGPSSWGKTAVVDFSVAGIQEKPLRTVSVGSKNFRAYEVFKDQAQGSGQLPVCMYVYGGGVYDAFLALKGAILEGSSDSVNISVEGIEEAELFLQHHFRTVSEAGRPEPYSDKLAYDPSIPKLADVIFSAGPVLKSFKFDGRADIYIQVDGVDPDDIWKERSHHVLVRDRERFKTPQFLQAFDTFFDSPFRAHCKTGLEWGIVVS